MESLCESGDRRMAKRVDVDDNTLILSNATTRLELGNIVDLSKAGLSFDYIVMDEPLLDLEHVTIAKASGEICMENIPCRLVSCFDLQDNDYSPVKMRQCGIKFGTLSDEHLKGLKDLLETRQGFGKPYSNNHSNERRSGHERRNGERRKRHERGHAAV